MAELTVLRYVRELVANLNRETALYEKLAGTARGAASAAGRRDHDALNELLRTKKGLIEELRVVTETTDGLRRELTNHQKVPRDVQESVSEALERARSALEMLLDLERANEESFKAVTDSMRTELVEIARGRRLLEGYRATREATEPLFMDKRQ